MCNCFGYTNVNTTDIYADVVMKKKVDVITRMNGIIG